MIIQTDTNCKLTMLIVKVRATKHTYSYKWNITWLTANHYAVYQRYIQRNLEEASIPVWAPWLGAQKSFLIKSLVYIKQF